MRSTPHGWLIVLGCVLLPIIGCTGSPVAPNPIGTAGAQGATMNQASERPFVGGAKGVVVFDFSNPKGCAAGFTTVTDAKGTATHLGLTALHSEHCVTPTGGMEGTMVLTGANGDEIHATYSGNSTAPGGIGESIHVTASVVIAGGTGRFANASGRADLTASIIFEGFEKLTWPGEWDWEGVVSF